jgi:hypothetical protein
MMEFAISSIRDVPGVNLELLGMANREQAGVVESQRSRQALTVLAPLFSNLRRYRKNQGKMSLYFIREYIPEGRMIRIVGEEGAQVVPMMKDPLMAEYDVIVEQSPTSPNSKTEAWLALRDVLPVLQAAGMQPPMEIVDVLPLPESMTAKWKETIKKGPPPEIKAKIDEMMQEIQGLQQENQQLQMGQQADMAKIQVGHEHKMHELEMKSQQFQMELALKQQELEATSQLGMAKIQSEMQMKREQMTANLQLDTEKAVAELSIKKETCDAEMGMKREETMMKYSGDEAKSMEESREKMKNEMISAVKGEIETSQKQMMEFVASSIIESVKLIAESINKPKVLVFDKSGNPIGSKPVDRLN